MAAKIVITPDRFIVIRDDAVVSVPDSSEKADRIARHFKRLQPDSKVTVQDTSTREDKKL